MRITAILCFSLTIPAFFHAGCAVAPPDADKSGDKQPITMPRFKKPLSIIRAETVEDALDYSKDEKIVLGDVSDSESTLGSPAMYVLLRRAEMLPEGDKTLEEAERPSPKNLWREPGRYRNRLVRLKVFYAGRATLWTENVVSGRWWGRRDVWVVDVLVEVEKTKPPSYELMVVVMGHEPPKNLKNRQPLELVGLFYKLAKLREDAEEGDPNVKDEYPVIVASSLLPPRSEESDFRWAVAVMIIAVMIMLFVFMRLRRGVSRQRAAGVREYQPTRPDNNVEAATGEVDEELQRQVKLHQAEKREKDADNA